MTPPLSFLLKVMKSFVSQGVTHDPRMWSSDMVGWGREHPWDAVDPSFMRSSTPTNVLGEGNLGSNPVGPSMVTLRGIPR